MSSAKSGHTNPISVSSTATTTWDLDTELRMYAELPVDGIGLSATKLAPLGWPKVLETVRTRQIRVAFVAYALTSMPGDDARWQRDIQVLNEALEAAVDLEAPTVFFTSGPSGDLTWEQAAQRLGERLSPVLQRASELGVDLAVENTMSMNGHISFNHSVRDTVALAELLDIGVCVDLLCGAQDAGLAQTLSRAIDRIRVVQVSDFRWGTRVLPNRWVPGDGDLPLADLLKRTLDVGYTGLIDIEILGPAIDAEGAESALRRSIDWVNAELGRG